MDSLANAIAGQDPVAVAGSWFRHLPARFRDRAMEGRPAYSRWGRLAGFPILYLGRPADSVVVEAYRHLVDPVDDPAILSQLAPRVLVSAQVAVTEILDLRRAGPRVELGLTVSQITSSTDDRAAYAACQEVAAASHQQGFHGIIAPAATGLGETLVLFTNRLPGHEVPVATGEVYWDRLPADPRIQLRPKLRIVKNE